MWAFCELTTTERFGVAMLLNEQDLQGRAGQAAMQTKPRSCSLIFRERRGFWQYLGDLLEFRVLKFSAFQQMLEQPCAVVLLCEKYYCKWM